MKGTYSGILSWVPLKSLANPRCTWPAQAGAVISDLLTSDVREGVKQKFCAFPFLLRCQQIWGAFRLELHCPGSKFQLFWWSAPWPWASYLLLWEYNKLLSYVKLKNYSLYLVKMARRTSRGYIKCLIQRRQVINSSYYYSLLFL